MAETLNLNLEGLEKFLAGIEKLESVSKDFKAAMGEGAKGRSKSALELRELQKKVGKDFTQLFAKTAKIYGAASKNIEAQIKKDTAMQNRRIARSDALAKKKIDIQKLDFRAASQQQRLNHLSNVAQVKLTNAQNAQAQQHAKITANLAALAKRTQTINTAAALGQQQKQAHYAALTALGLSRQSQTDAARLLYQGKSQQQAADIRTANAQQRSDIRLSESAIRRNEAYEYNKRTADEGVQRRAEERADKRSEKRWMKLEKFAIETTGKALAAPFRLLAWGVGKTLHAVGSTLHALRSVPLLGGVLSAGGIGALVGNVSGNVFQARATGTGPYTSQYFGSTFKGIFDAESLMGRVAGIRANPIGNLAYSNLFSGGHAGETTQASALRLAQYAYGKSRQAGTNVGVLRMTDPLLQQFSTEELLAMSNTPEEEWNRRVGQTKGEPNLSNKTTAAILDFDVKLNQLAIRIKGYFATKLVPALKPLENLGHSFKKLFEKLFTDARINKFVEFVGSSIDKMANWLGDDKNLEKIGTLWNNLTGKLSEAWDAISSIDWKEVAGTIKSIYGGAKSAVETGTSIYDTAKRKIQYTKDWWLGKAPQQIRGNVGRYKDIINQFSGFAYSDIDNATIGGLMAAESGGLNSASSNAGAKGLMQLIPKWHPGVDVDNPTENIREGTRYLIQLYKMFKGKGASYGVSDLDMAFFAYNHGEGATQKLLQNGTFGDAFYNDAGFQKYLQNIHRYSDEFRESGELNPAGKAEPLSLNYPRGGLNIQLSTRGLIADPNVMLSGMPGAANGGLAFSTGAYQVG